ncbi:MAG: MiaB/RimO family radical SAM methylthiotransferase [Lachnospiraceae bacterium]|nr:MiaB/RimO family radical SAM methylthiotransferase [Lachnospiraceae bacterium]
MDKKRVAFLTLGCKVNSYETDAMSKLFADNGYEIVKFNQVADVYVINTCSVTNMADRKSRQMLHRARKKNPNGLIVATGCYVQASTEEVSEDIAVDLLVGNNKKSEIVNIVEEYIARINTSKVNTIDINDTKGSVVYEDMFIEQTGENTRAYIKIQDGCNQFCSYCIIPYARGRVRSRDKDSIIEEVALLAKNGYKEVVLTGIHISSYGLDFEKNKNLMNKHVLDNRLDIKETLEHNLYTDSRINDGEQDYLQNTTKTKGFVYEYLLDVIESIALIDGIERIRLGSLEPRIISDDFIGRLSKINKVCPHFHLSLQSGCDETLKRMNRKYTAAEYSSKCDILRRYYDNPAITTDVIVGFAGETMEEFHETEKFLKEINFAEMHIFKYSIRKGTVAARMQNQVNDVEKNNRSKILLDMNSINHKNYINSFVGTIQKVLFEEKIQLNDRHYFVGHNERYVKVVVEIGYEEGMVKTDIDVSNSIWDVKINGLLNDEMICGILI